MKQLKDVDLPAALARLKERDDVGKLLNIESVRESPALARSPEYRRAYNHYYRMRQKSLAFYDAYYQILAEAVEKPIKPSLGEVLVKLHQATGERHLSFGSKLLATVAPDAVIYDRNVATLFGISTKQLPADGWLEEAQTRYQQLTERMKAIVEDKNWPTTALLPGLFTRQTLRVVGIRNDISNQIARALVR